MKAILTSAGSGTVSAESAKTLVQFLLGPQRSAKLDKELGKSLSKERRKSIEEALVAAGKESDAASKRVVDLLAGVQKLHEQMHEENVRHFLALSTIATAEVDRWTTTGMLMGEINPIFGRKEKVEQKKSTERTTCSDCELLDKPTDKNAPQVTLDSHVLPSLRSLAAYANKTQMVAPGVKIEDSEPSQHAAARLARAYQAVQGFELVTAVNTRRAAENTIALVSEVEEHSVHLDDLLTTGVELDIRYSLDELMAFHSSGVTDEDLQVLISTVQSGLLAWIGARQ
ncbi:MAG: hypothetical protein QM783_12415 [Phycisphaerales bacterium]